MLSYLDPKFDWYRTKIPTLGQGGYTVYFRGLTRREFTQYITKKANNPEEGIEYLLHTAVYNYDSAKLLYGVGVKLVKEIAGRSVSPEAEIPMNEAKGWLDTEMGGIEADAVCFIPGLSLETLDECKPTNYFKYLIMGQRLKMALNGPEPVNDLAMQQTIVPPTPGQPGAEIMNFSWSKS